METSTDKLDVFFALKTIEERFVTITGISYIYAHVPMSPRVRTSVPDDWSVIKVS